MAEDTSKPAEVEQDATATRAARIKLFVESFEGGVKPHTRRLTVHDMDPSYDYRLVKNTPEHIEYRQSMGYEIDTSEDVKTSSMVQADKRKIVAGSYVLMRREVEIGEAHRVFLRKKARMLVEGPRATFKETARRLNVDTVDRSHGRRAPMSAVMGETSSFRELKED